MSTHDDTGAPIEIGRRQPSHNLGEHITGKLADRIKVLEAQRGRLLADAEGERASLDSEREGETWYEHRHVVIGDDEPEEP